MLVAPTARPKVESPGEQISIPAHRNTYRRPEVDVLRGFAVVLMICYHGFYDLWAFGVARPVWLTSVPRSLWLLASEIIGIQFFLIVGVSAWLKKRSNPSAGFLAHFLRGGRLFLFALLVTAVTAVLTPSKPVYFGALHCIAVISWLLYPFLRTPRVSGALGIVLAGFGFWLSRDRLPFPWTFVAGLPPPALPSSDWYPLLPWLGVALTGSAIASRFYGEPRRSLRLPDVIPLRGLAFLGRRALFVYLLHQPALVAVLWLLGLVSMR